jgi:uncharacterized protein YneF (UPF0154 family)
MEGAVKNILIILIIVTLAFGGYYFYVQKAASDLSSSPAEQQMVQNMLARTQVFIDRSQQLDKISLDLSILEDPRFKSLQSFSKPVKEQPAGRPDPFAAAGSSEQTSSQ